MRTSDHWIAALLLCFVIGFSTSGCGGIDPDTDGRQVAEWVLEAGGTLTISGTTVPVKSKADLPDGDIAILTIDLNERDIANKDLANLIGLKNLTTLGLHQTNVSDKGLEYLDGIDTLTELELSYTRISDKGLEKLANFPNLQKVYLSGTLVTDEGIKKLTNALPNVTIVRF